MRFLTSTIITLAVINLIIGNLAPAQEAPITSQNPNPMESALSETDPEPTPTQMGMVTISGRTFINDVVMTGLPGNPVTDQLGYYTANVPLNWTGIVTPKKKGFVFQPSERFYNRITSNITKENYLPKGVVPIPVFNQAGREILVIPAAEIKPEDLVAATEDLQVMTHIFDEKFKQPQEIQGVFVDFGDIFGRDSRKTEAIYIQGYGALFLMEVNFAFTPEPKTEEKQTEETEKIDPIWQRARQKIFSPDEYYEDSEFTSEKKYSADKIEQLKQELVRTLKHTTNIRLLQPDEMIILTVIGKARQAGGMYQYNFSRSRTPRTRTSSSRGRSSSRTEGGMYGMGGGMGGGGYVSGGGMGGGGMGGMGGGMMGGGSFGGGMMMGGGMMGGMGAFMEDYSETGSAPATVLTIRVKKSDVDDFAKGKIDFKQFQEKVDIFTY